MEPGQSWSDASRGFEANGAPAGDVPILRLRYLPLHLLTEWDLRYEHGLDELIYVQNLIEEDDGD